MTPHQSTETPIPEDDGEAALAALEEEDRKLGNVTGFLSGESTTVRSADELVTVEFDGWGEVVGIAFDGVEYLELTAAEFGEVLVETIRDGRARCVRKLIDELGEELLPGVDFAELEARERVEKPVHPPVEEDRGDGVLGRSITPVEEVRQRFPKGSSLAVQCDDGFTW
ncbi:hypothetical protein [Amycolatopsis sp. NPDC059657]|uniref:hypothetical protein n=1 Tax=Amycolatopsis sp. NPDC059657 TaxID=3346899 RepID=UPI00366D6D00